MSDLFAKPVDPMPDHGARDVCSASIRTAEDPDPDPDLEPALPEADADADAPELVADAARPFPMVLVGTQEDDAAAGCAAGVGFWPWKKVEVP